MAKKTRPPALRKALNTRAMEVEDPEWRSWFLKVDQKKRALADLKKRPFVVSTYDKEGQEWQVARQKSDPLLVKQLIKKVTRDLGTQYIDDMELIRHMWEKAAGSGLAEESSVYSFRSGVLMIEVYSGILLQEIRQFSSGDLLARLRKVWPAKVPLVDLRFRLGKR